MKNILIYIIIISFALIFSANEVFSQNAIKQKQQLAKSFEQNADYENAARMYEELINDGDNSDETFYSLVNCRRNLAQYSALIEITKNKSKKSGSSELFSLLAELYWRTGNTSDANKTWEETIDKFGSFADTYKYVANSQIALQLFDKAINTYLTARKKIDNPNLFIDELSKLYIATGNYIDGGNEAIALLNSTNNLSQVQGRIYALMSNKDSEKYFEEFLSNLSQKNSNNILYQELYAWYLKTIDKTDEAFEVYKRLDKLRNSKGRDILYYADLLAKDDKLEQAIKAYNYLIDQEKDTPYFSNALFGFANTYEKMLFKSNYKNTLSVDDVIDKYKYVIKEFGKSQFAADCFIRIARLQISQKNDFAGAEENLMKVIKDFPNLPATLTAYFELAELKLKANKIEDAIIKYKDILLLKKLDKVSKLNVEFKLAKIDYFLGNFDKCKEALSILKTNTNDDIGNNSLELLVFIETNSSNINELKQYAHAELLLLQNQEDKAFEILDNLSKLEIESDIPELSLIKCYDIQKSRKSNENSRQYLLNIVNDKYSSIHRDFALIELANSFFEDKLLKDASKYYSEILINYPNSIYLNEARQKLRKIKELGF